MAIRFRILKGLPWFWLAVALSGWPNGPLAGDEEGLAPLAQNGFVFSQDSEPFPLRCLEIPALLSNSGARQDALLDQAVMAGFNAVSFEITLFGPGGLAPRLGSLDSTYLGRVAETLARLRSRQIYAFPILWTAAKAAAFERAVGGRPGYFWGFRRHQEWEFYLLRQLAAAGGSGEAGPLKSPLIGGWILYDGEVPVAQREFRSWTLFTIRSLRVLGMKQMAGLALNPRPLATPTFTPVPAETAAPGSSELTAPPAPADIAPVPPLLDKESLHEILKQFPIPTTLDFFRVDLGQPATTEQLKELKNWEDLDEIEVPLVWRVDWSRMSPGRRRAFTGFKGISGVSGPLSEGEAVGEMWAPAPRHVLGTPRPVALAVSELQAYIKNEKTVLQVRLNRPGTVRLYWGKAWPLTRTASSLDPALLHRLPLKGLKAGDLLLARAWADSEKWGSAVQRTAWVRVTHDEKDAEADPAMEKSSVSGKMKRHKNAGHSPEKREKKPAPVSAQPSPTETEDLPLSSPPPKAASPGEPAGTKAAEPEIPEAEPVEGLPSSQVPSE